MNFKIKDTKHTIRNILNILVTILLFARLTCRIRNTFKHFALNKLCKVAQKTLGLIFLKKTSKCF